MFASRSTASHTPPGRAFCHDLSVTRTVLIVDDHPSFRASARAMLEAEGFEVVGELENGSSVVDTVNELRPDVVLLDIQLPDMSGFDVCSLLESFDDENVKIILVSSRDLSDYGELVETSCACGFVAKGELSGDTIAALLA
jgi:DNA-binding NarL/FixJ family response regulator